MARGVEEGREEEEVEASEDEKSGKAGATTIEPSESTTGKRTQEEGARVVTRSCPKCSFTLASSKRPEQTPQARTLPLLFTPTIRDMTETWQRRQPASEERDY